MGGRRQVFKEAWMDRCYESLVYPNPSCVQLLEEVNAALARHVREPLGSELRQQALFLLLGPEFTTRHFPYHRYNVRMLEPPLNPRQKEKYLYDAQVFLDGCLTQALADCGYPGDVTGYRRGDTLLGRFLTEVRGAYREGVNQQAAVRMFEEETDKRRQMEKRKKKIRERQRWNDEEEEKNQEEEKQEEEEEEEEDPHVDIGLSDVAGEALVAVMLHDKKKRDGTVRRLRGKYLPLPNSLRRYLWWGVLVGKEEGVGEEEEVKGRFKSRLEKEMKRQKVKRGIESQEWRKIDNDVIEVYDQTPVLRHLDNDHHLLQTARSLNLLTVHNRAFSPSSIFLLLPLLLLLRHQKCDEDDEEEENDDEAEVMRVAVWGELLTRHCVLGVGEVFAVAEEVLGEVGKEDQAYLSHLNTCLAPAQVEKVNVKLFPPEVLLRDGKASAKLHAQLSGGGRGGASRSLPAKSEKVFGDPGLFVRKWLAQVFVGVVGVKASLWVWDMLFLDGWRQVTLRQVCVALLALIRPWVMQVHDYGQVTQVLLEGPGRVYLSDLRRALAHLEGGGTFQDAPHTAAYLGGGGAGEGAPLP